MNFIAGQPLDVQALNELASYPKIMTFDMPAHTGAS